jgi:hypothetical protein
VQVKPADEKKTDFMDAIDPLKEITITVWYARNSSESGSGRILGLPGLKY